MDAIWQFLSSSPFLIIALLVVVALVFAKLSGAPEGKPEPEDLVPHYKRFERRESELGNRRQQEAQPPNGQDRRSIGRRAGDWIRRKR